jgi:DNA processing protein
MSDPLAWLTLTNIPGLGPVGISALIAEMGSPDRVLASPMQVLRCVPGIGPRLAHAILNLSDRAWAKSQIRAAKQADVSILPMDDPNYPGHLREIYAPPPILYYRGNIALCSAPTIAIVGSRAFTPYGRQIAYQLAGSLAEAGVSVISGMAAGIDTHAHRGALDPGGATAAVLGSSLDQPYPPQNIKLFHQICDQGVALSEFPLTTKPEAHNFPRRNRIISGLSLGTVVVEAGARSGALITAEFALEQNREVFAVPGPINSGRSTGTNRLIQQGAQLVHCADDILLAIGAHIALDTLGPLTKTRASDLNPSERRVLDTLSPQTSVQVNQLSRQLSMSPSEILQTLLSLEMKGCVIQLPGSNYRKST